MLRGLFNLILVVIVIVAIAAFLFGYRWGRPAALPGVRVPAIDRPIATTGAQGRADTAPANRTPAAERGREVGAQIGEKIAVGASEAKDALKNAALTAKVKSKMTLDDTLKGSRINVDTTGTVVTLSGPVVNAAQKARALQLTRETEGVTQVVDRLSVQ